VARDKHEQIRIRAHQIWEDEGRPNGGDVRHWLQALDELAGEDDHETLQELMDQDDRLDDAARQPLNNAVADLQITTGDKSAKQKIKKTEGP
jgi:hypothetical protein